MNRNRFITVFFLVFSFELCLGQTQFFTLNDQKIQLANKAYNITKVIDARDNKSNIGWTQKGMTNVKVYANLINSLNEEVLNFLRNNLNSNGPNVQLIIRDLKISEKTGAFSEKAFCELSVEFVFESDSSVSRVFQSAHKSEAKGIDVTKMHPENIANAFQLCFKELESSDFNDIQKFKLVNQVKDSVKHESSISDGDIQSINIESPSSNTEDSTIEEKKAIQTLSQEEAECNCCKVYVFREVFILTPPTSIKIGSQKYLKLNNENFGSFKLKPGVHKINATHGALSSIRLSIKLNCEKSRRYNVVFSNAGIITEARLVSDLDANERIKEYDETESLVKWKE